MMLKTRFGHSLKARTPSTQYAEVMLRCICHNIACLVMAVQELGVEPKYWARDLSALPDFGTTALRTIEAAQTIGAKYDVALGDLFHRLRYLFGSVQVHAALGEGLEGDLRTSLHSFAQGIADVISSAYVTEALARSREATGNMFEALAAGARVAHKSSGPEEATGIVHALATIAACEGRPEILALETAEHSALPSE